MPRPHNRVFYDATSPLNIPKGSLAAVYVNASGSFAWTQSEVNRMGGVFGISESGDPYWMRFGRCVAVEPGAASPQQAPACLAARRQHGHTDGMCYVNQGNWEETEHECIAFGEDPDWWVAAPGISDPDQLRSPIKGKMPLAVQTEWRSAYDVSVILQHFAFTDPRHFRATGGH